MEKLSAKVKIERLHEHTGKVIMSILEDYFARRTELFDELKKEMRSNGSL